MNEPWSLSSGSFKLVREKTKNTGGYAQEYLGMSAVTEI
jgi:hypothetical protein